MQQLVEENMLIRKSSRANARVTRLVHIIAQIILPLDLASACYLNCSNNSNIKMRI
jgi:hypothetical protein